MDAKLEKLAASLEADIGKCEANIQAAEETATVFRNKRKKLTAQLAQVRKQLKEE